MEEKDPPGNLHGSSHIGTEGTFGVCLLGLANIAKPRAIWNALNSIARLGRREEGRTDQHVILWAHTRNCQPLTAGIHGSCQTQHTHILAWMDVYSCSTWAIMMQPTHNSRWEQEHAPGAHTRCTHHRTPSHSHPQLHTARRADTTSSDTLVTGHRHNQQ